MVKIETLETYTQMCQVQKLHQLIWGLPIGAGLYPPMLYTVAKNGGTVLGAFDNDKLIAFLFGFLGRNKDGKIKLCSQTMGVLPEYRHQGIGAKLKWRQRKKMLDEGIDLITWTFDPLEAPNAYLNLHKLGAVTNKYLVNIYGENFTALGSGVPSDRFVVSWWLKSPLVEMLEEGNDLRQYLLNLPLINKCTGNSQRKIMSIDFEAKDQELLYEIPKDFQYLRKNDMELALDWRFKTREVIQHFLSAGYWIVDLVIRDNYPCYVISGKISEQNSS